MIGKNLFLDYKRCPFLFLKNKDKKKFYLDKEKQDFKKKVLGFFFGEVPKAKELPTNLLILELKKHKIVRDLKVFYKEFYGNVHILEMVNNGYQMVEIVPKQIIKEKTIDLLALKYFILSQNQISPSKCIIIKIREDFKKEGELDFIQLTEYKDVTRIVLKRLPFIKEIAKKLLSEKNFPQKKDANCFKPMKCKYFSDCWGEIEDDSVLNLIAMPIGEKITLLKNGVKRISEVDENRLTNFQRIQKKSLITPFIDREKLAFYMEQFKGDLYFLDFESYQPIIPYFNEMKPYEPIVFQYSLHILKEDGTLTHESYLGNIKKEDPRETIGSKLTALIPKNRKIIAYGAQFERRVLRDLAQHSLLNKDHLESLAENVIDLNEPFKNRYCYFPKMGAKHSLKAVLHSFIEDLSYKDLIVGNGQELLDEYKEILFGNEENISAKKKKLLKYCKTDTLALVKIYQKLRQWNS